MCKARVMCRTDGTPWIHSFAHGRTVSELRFDVRAAKATLEKASKEEAADAFIRLLLAGDLDTDESERLRDIPGNRSAGGTRDPDSNLKPARPEQLEHH